MKKRRITAICMAFLMLWQLLPVNALAEAITLLSNDTGAVVTHKVTFVISELDANGNLTEKTIIDDQLVADGAAAVVPDVPDVEGYAFTNTWKSSVEGSTVECVKAETTFTAQYKKLQTRTVTVKFQYADGSEARQTQVYEYDAAGENQLLTVTPDLMEGFTLSVKDEANAVVTLTDGRFVVNVSELTQDKTYTVTYSGNETTYTVKHYEQNIDDTAYTLADTQTLSGTVGTMTAAAANAEAGFTAEAFEQTRIAPDGSTVIEIYYTRNTYKLNYNTNGGTYVDNEVVPYGKSITVASVAKAGYTFQGWTMAVTANGETTTTEYDNASNKLTTFTMPAGDVTLTAKWTAVTSANYMVVYWKESVPTDTGADAMGATWEYDSSEVRSAVPGTIVGDDASEYTAKKYEGFKTTPHHIDQVTVAADGSSVLNVYYERQVYTFSFYDVEYDRRGNVTKKTELTDLRIVAKYGVDISKVWGNTAHTQTSSVKTYSWENPDTGDYYTLFANMPAENLEFYTHTTNGSQSIVYYVETLEAGKYKVYRRFNGFSFSRLTAEDKQPITGFSFSKWKESGTSTFTGQAVGEDNN